jgi:hypothetical protein
VDRIAIGVYRGAANGAVFISYVMGFFSRKGTLFHRLVKCLIGVSYFQRYVANTITVLANMLGSGIIGRHGSGQEEVRLALTEGIGGSLALSRFQSAIRYLGKAESFAIEEGRLARIADKKFNVMYTLKLEWVLHRLSPGIIFAYFSHQNNGLLWLWTPARTQMECRPAMAFESVFHFTSIDTNSPSCFPITR